MSSDIRLATSADIPAIMHIYNQAVAMEGATAHTSPVSEAERHAWLAAHDPQHYPVYVAGRDGVVVAYCSLSAYRPGRMALWHTAEISYYVHEDWRGQGVGSELIAYTIKQCPQLDVKTLFAILLDINSDSVGILQKFGFSQWGHLPDVAEFNGRECGHLYYGLRVSD